MNTNSGREEYFLAIPTRKYTFDFAHFTFIVPYKLKILHYAKQKIYILLSIVTKSFYHCNF